MEKLALHHKKKVRVVSPIYGFDSETINGYARLVCTDNQSCRVDKLDDLISFLFYKHNFKTGTWFIVYNLDYDVSAILKYLPSELMSIIYSGIAIEIGQLKIRYYKGKELKLTCNNISLYFYDCYQLYHTSLNEASKKYLNQKKLDVDVKKISASNIYDDDTIKYCMQDALLAKNLFLKFKCELPDEIKETKPLSTAYYSAHYFKDEIKNNKPITSINKLYKRAFYGGRFEIYRKGYFRNIYYYDINSAYPSTIQKLLSLKNVIHKNGYQYDSNATYGVYCIDIWISNNYYSPISYRQKNGLIIYPVGELKSVWITKSEMEIIITEGYQYRIRYCVQTYCQTIDTPFFDKVNELYLQKQKGHYAYKIILNSLYGKFCQSIEKYGKCKDNTEYKIKDLLIINNESYYRYNDYMNSNYIYASEITSRTRKQLYDILKNNYKNTIALFTDCIISTKKISEIELGKDMGQYKLEKFKQMWIIGSGIYFYETSKGELRGHYRGFALKEPEKIFNKITHAKTSKIKMEIIERESLIKASLDEGFFKEFGNKIYALTKDLNLNFDTKRIWNDDFLKGKDITHKQIDSIAIPIL